MFVFKDKVILALDATAMQTFIYLFICTVKFFSVGVAIFFERSIFSSVIVWALVLADRLSQQAGPRRPD